MAVWLSTDKDLVAMYEGAGAYKYNTFMKSTCSHDLDIELVTSDIPRGSGQILIPAVISPMYIFK